ncbi:MAG TPA: FUSC family protein, partial [Capillimicrobium sp.]|nr:FUSC family protein [Capillimicrobium sp.]
MPAATEGRLPSLHPHDPGHLALRAGVLVAAVTPLVFAIGLAIGDQAGLFAIFGALSLMVFVDFSGPTAVRAIAYGTLSLAGCVLIAIGTLCSRSPALAASAMAVVGLAVLFAGVLNGYLATATPAALLSFILPAMVPAGAGAIPERIAGWLLACAVAVPAVLLVFGRHPRDRLREAIADATRAVADVVEDRAPERVAVAGAALEELRSRFAATPYRPTGPTGATGALADIVDEVDWLRATCVVVIDPAAPAGTAAEQALYDDSAAVLRASAALVAGDPAAQPDVERLETGRERVRAELIADLAAMTGAGDDEVWTRLRRAWETRLVSFAALDVAGNARLAGGGDGGDGPRWARFVVRQRIALAASRHLIAAHAGVRSVWFRNSVRAAAGLAIAVLLAHEASVQHGFWVVLGVLSVLRSSAVGTARTILAAFAGTLAGILVAAVVIALLDDDRALLWVALVPACFFAAYAPRALGFAAGQAGFSLAVLVAFNLIAPTGWEVGLVRIEDVSIGFAISLGVGLLLWPRGARALLQRALGDAFAAAGHHTALAAGRMFGAPSGGVGPAAAAADAAAGRLDAAVRQRLAERGPHDAEHVAAGLQLVSGAGRLRRTGLVLERLHELTPGTPPTGLDGLVGGAFELGAWYAALGDSLAARAAPPRPEPPRAELRAALVGAVRDAAA